MATQSEVVKQSELLNQLVINRDTMEELGRVEVLWMYAPSHRVLGFVCKSGLFAAKKKAFKLTQVVALGSNGILTHSAPEETDAEKVSQLETVIHCEVWSDSGKKIGKITDYIFTLRTGEISKYLFVSSGLEGVTGEVYELFPSQILNIGRRRVLVPEYALNSLSVYRGGIKQTLTKAGEFLKEEKEQITEELKTFTKRAQETTQQAKGRLWNLTDQLKGRANSISQEARERIHSLSEQLREETQLLADQALERSHDWAEQVREQSQTIGEQVEDGIQTLTVQAREILDTEEDEELNQTSGLKAEEDPDDFFDSLFADDEESSLAPPSVSEPVQTPGVVEASTNFPHPSPSSPLLPKEEDSSDFTFEDFWDTPSSQPTASQPEATPSSQQPVGSRPEIEDDWESPPNSSQFATCSSPQPEPSQSEIVEDDWDMPSPQPSSDSFAKPIESTSEDDDDEPWI